MKVYLILYFAALCLVPIKAFAQISHGGSPLPFTELRSNAGFYEEMPGFDLQEQLNIDSLEYSSLRASNRFAYKFITDFTLDNSGEWVTLANGTRVWRLGIRSANAYSINLLFTAFELPEGAQLFIYNPDQTHVLGAFTHLNNSENGILPVSPVEGERLIVEYHEPLRVAFQGKLCIGEVNHDYRGWRSLIEPSSDLASLSCIQPLSCSIAEGDPYAQIGRSVVELIIDGTYYCTGTLINNSRSDGTPYLLTASHCLNQQFKLKNPDYEKIAGRIVAFFNYNSPMCESSIRGTEEMSMASTKYCAVYEDVDLALLKFLEIPPIYYRPYYSGWNATKQHKGEYVCIQHPMGGTKRFSLTNELRMGDLVITEHDFQKNAFWNVKSWSVGCTAEGSSGSPLYDNDNRIIGVLTGGNSYCDKPNDDYFYSLYSAWRPDEAINHQLQYWLAPNSDEPTVCDGLDPYSNAPAVRLSHVFENGKQDAMEAALYDGNSYQFGQNDSGVTECAEAYQLETKATVYGCYLVTPAVSGRTTPVIEICLYSGKEKPEKLLAKQKFNPQVSYFDKDVLLTENKSLYRAQEHFISFGDSIEVQGKLFVSYRMSSEKNAKFCAYNVKEGELSTNTAWLRTSEGWGKSPFNTALFIDPVVQYKSGGIANQPSLKENPVRLYTDRSGKSLYVVLPEAKGQAALSIFDMSGKLVRRTEWNALTTSISLASSPAGVYIAIVRYDGEEYSCKVRIK